MIITTARKKMLDMSLRMVVVVVTITLKKMLPCDMLRQWVQRALITAKTADLFEGGGFQVSCLV